MKRKMTLLVFLMSAAAVSLCFAGDDPLMGTWKLNESKSKIPAGTPKNSTVVYAQSGDEVTITVDGEDGSGKPMHHEWTGKFDGKDYPAKGDVNQDMRAYKKVDANTVTYTVKREGKTVGHGKVVVAADGKSRKTSQTMTLANGKTVTQTAVFDKQ
ncbi:MAG TPA: hypothetical protein VIW21_08585 [Chthoniobacterales bacterium]|jgi:hypothetical protein